MLLQGETLSRSFTMREPHANTELNVDLTEWFKSNQHGKGCPLYSMDLVRDTSDGALTPKEADVFELQGFNLRHVVPSPEEYAGNYSIFIRATTSVELSTYLNLKLTLIDPCDSE